MSEIDFGALVTTEISPDNFTGEDISFDEAFEWLQSELAKLTNPVLAPQDDNDPENKSRFIYEPVDWDKVIETSLEILRAKSKDLRVVVYLTRGLIETQGVSGITNGLSLAYELSKAHWDKIFPTRERTRSVAFGALKDQILECIDDKEGPAKTTINGTDIELLDKAVNITTELNSFLREKLLNEPVSLGYLETTLDKLLTEAKKKGAPPPQPATTPTVQQTVPIPQPTSQATSAPPPSAKPEFDFSKDADRGKYLLDLRESAVKLHAWARDHAPSDPVAHKFIRMVYWAPLAYPPETLNLTLPGPNQVLQDNLIQQWENQNWLDLLKATETSFPTLWYWLDLQRYACDAMENLGNQFDLARRAIIDEVTFFLQRLPHFANMKTQDGIPVASEETQDWLKTVSSTAHQQESNESVTVTSSEGGHEDGKTDKTFDSSEPIDKGLERAREYLQTTHGGRERHIVQLRLTEYLLGKKNVPLAFSYVEPLEEYVTTFQLAQWEPDLALQTLHLLHTCLIRMSKVNKDSKNIYLDRCRQLLPQLAALDPVIAAKAAKDCK